MREPSVALATFEDSQRRRIHAFDEFISSGLLPRPTPRDAPLEIDAILASAENPDSHDFIRLHNPGGSAVDLSGWTLSGVGTTLPPGAVLPAGSCAVVVADDPSYRRHTGGGEYVFAEFDEPLNPAGGSLEIRRSDGSIAAWAPYDPDSVDGASVSRCNGR